MRKYLANDIKGLMNDVVSSATYANDSKLEKTYGEI